MISKIYLASLRSVLSSPQLKLINYLQLKAGSHYLTTTAGVQSTNSAIEHRAFSKIILSRLF